MCLTWCCLVISLGPAPMYAASRTVSVPVDIMCVSPLYCVPSSLGYHLRIFAQNGLQPVLKESAVARHATQAPTHHAHRLL